VQPPWTLVSSKHCCPKLVSSSANRTTDAQVCGNRDGESAPACRQVLKRYEWGLFVTVLATVVGSLVVVVVAIALAAR
jgi:hypothetical protein